MNSQNDGGAAATHDPVAGRIGADGTGSGGSPAAPATPLRRAMTLRSRMLLALLGMLGLICLVIGFTTYSAMATQLTDRLDADLAQASNRAISHVSRSGATNPVAAPGQASGTLSFMLVGDRISLGGVLDSATGERLTVSALSSQDVKALLASAEDIVEENDGAGGPASTVARTLHLSIGDYRVVSADLGPSTLITGLPLSAVQSTLSQLAWTITLVAILGLAATGLIGSVIVRRSLQPLERVAAVANQAASLPLEAGPVNLAHRVPVADAVPGTEAGTMGAALNRLLDNVSSALDARQASEEKLRQFVSDASHELRTPLAAIRGYSELLSATEHLSEDGSRGMQRVIEQSRRMGALVDDLLLLARLDAARPGAEGAADRGTGASEQPSRTHRPVDLTQLIAEEAADFRVAGPEHHWRLDLPAEPVSVLGDAAQLRQVVTNLLSNARKHTPAGTTVTVGLRTGVVLGDSSPGYGRGPAAVLTVTDTGAGIARDFLPRVFERFTRADAARSGGDGTTGLGLPIAEAIARAHGGTITVENVYDDGANPADADPAGARFTVRLPLAPPAA